MRDKPTLRAELQELRKERHSLWAKADRVGKRVLLLERRRDDYFRRLSRIEEQERLVQEELRQCV